MLYLFHGDDVYQSRRKFSDGLKKYQTIRFFSPSEINTESIRTFSAGLFSSQKQVLAFENLFSLPQANLAKIIPLIKKIAEKSDVFVWQGKKLPAKNISPWGQNSKIFLFRLPANIFKLLDSLGVNKKQSLLFYRKTLATHPPELILAMAQRQLKELLLAKIAPENLKLAPWQKARILSQAQKLGLAQIKANYLELIKIDWQDKTGQLGNSLENELISFLAKL